MPTLRGIYGARLQRFGAHEDFQAPAKAGTRFLLSPRERVAVTPNARVQLPVALSSSVYKYRLSSFRGSAKLVKMKLGEIRCSN